MQLRAVVLAVAVLTGGLCAATAVVAAAAHPSPKGSAALVTPARGGGMTGGQLLGEAWATGNYTDGPNPLNGGCGSIARDVINPHFGDNLTATCTATQRTRLFLSWGTACFNVEFEEGAGETEGEQIDCAVRLDQAIQELNVTVDGETTDLVNPRFELFSPQRTVQLPEPNGFGIPAQEVTFTAHGWGAVVRRLRPGRHTVTFEVVAPDWGEPTTFTIILNVVRSGAD